MNNPIFLQWLALSLFAAFMGFCFCDGFKLHIKRKMIWFSIFLLITVYSLLIKGYFDFTYIIPVPSLLAVILCKYEKTVSSGKGMH